MNKLHFLLISFIFAFADLQTKKCCKAKNAKCLSCLENLSEREFCSLYPQTHGCPPEKFLRQPVFGGWSQYEDDIQAKWTEILDNGVIDVEGYGSEDLAQFGTPNTASTQVVAGTNYKFGFSDGSQVTVLEQLWMDPKIRITNIEKAKVQVQFCASSPAQLCRMRCPRPSCESENQCALRLGKCCNFECVDSSSQNGIVLQQAQPGSWSAFDGDFVAKWSEILTKATIKVDGLASEDLVALGTPQSASSQVVAGANYKFAFSDGTQVTVLEQVWMDPQMTITNIEMPEIVLRKSQPGSWSAYDGDFSAKWSEILKKATIKVDDFASEDLIALGKPESASSQVVAGTNYKFAFSDGTRVTVLEQVWMDPQITITNIDMPEKLAKEGQVCGGWSEKLAKSFPKCERGLVCKPSGKVSIPGAGNVCVRAYAKEGETCEGFDENSGKPFPKCGKGLTCKTTKEVSIPGAEKTCIKSTDILDSERKSCVLEDGEVVPSGWNGNGRGDNFCNKCGCHDGVYYCTEMFCGPIIEPKMECFCPVGRRELLINPDYFTCEVEGYELVMETTKYPCPDGTILDCGGPGYVCQNAKGDIMDTIDAEIPFECPQDPPTGFGEKCVGNAKCEYGKECCCGKCYPSEVYMCTGDQWISYFTDACMMPECEMPIPLPVQMDEIKCCKKDIPQGWDEGGICCSDGGWHADVGDGSTTCEEFGLEDSAQCPSESGAGLILNSTSNVPARKTTVYVLCVFFSIMFGVIAAMLYRSFCCTKIENTDFYTDLKADV